jgi:death on curing protein
MTVVADPLSVFSRSAIVDRPLSDQPSIRPTAAAHKQPSGTRTFAEFHMLAGSDILAIHAALVADFARTPDPIDPPGVKDENLLESAVGRQFTSLGAEPKYKTFAHMAASLFYGIALNHAFHNGNKRTAVVALICLADRNDLSVTASEKELYDFVLSVVNHEFRPSLASSASEATDAEVETMAGWITQRIRRKAHVQRMLRWRDLKAALRELDVWIGPATGSQLELVRKRLRTVVDFDGDTRDVGPMIVRKIRKDLRLTPKDGCDDDVFYGDALPLDHFIEKYRGLLRDLAHV